MNHRHAIIATTLLASGIAMGGCQSTSLFGGSSRISFHNASESAVNVDVFVQDVIPDSPTQGEFINVWSTQIARGALDDYKLTLSPSWRADADATVHVQVAPVAPSWEEASSSIYWFELLTQPPCAIVATGSASAMSFNSGSGQLAMIPADAIRDQTYNLLQVTASDGAPDADLP